MYLFTRHKVTICLTIAFLPVLLSGCQTIKKMGSVFPVYGERCEDWLCLGKKKPKTGAYSGALGPRRPVGTASKPMSVQGRMPPPQGRVPQIPSRNMPMPPPLPDRYIPAPPRAAPPVPEKSYGQSPAIPLAADTWRPQKSAQKNTAGSLHPWEENPEWKNDLPASPIDSLKQSLDW